LLIFLVEKNRGDRVVQGSLGQKTVACRADLRDGLLFGVP